MIPFTKPLTQSDVIDMKNQEIDALRAERNRLQQEREEALDILAPGKLYRLGGEEIPTTLIERAKMCVTCLAAESDHADEVHAQLTQLRAGIAALEQEIRESDYPNADKFLGWADRLHTLLETK